VRGRSGEMVPLDAVTTARFTTGPDLIPRFNGFPAAKINGSPAAGYSSGQAIAIMEELAGTLPEGYAIAWSGQAYEEKQSGGASALVFVFGLVMVFLILAAQYESWSLPGSVITAVPFGLLGALAAVCEARAAGGRRGQPLVVDPLLLAALPGAASGSRIARIEAIAGELATAERSFVPGAAAAAALEAWDAAGSGRDPALWRALEPCLERALTAPSASASRDVTFTPSRAQGPPWADEALAETCDELLRGGAQSIRLLTMPCAWSGDRPNELAAVAAARIAGGGALQLIRYHLEVNP